MQNTTTQLTPSQEKAVNHKDGALLVLAGPGSGKTRVITHRIANLINSGVAPYKICAITFTNKAAGQMNQRVAEMGTSTGAHISTFHSLCVRILRKYAQFAAIDSNFSIYDSADQKRCMKQAIKKADIDSKSFTPGKLLAAVSSLKNNLIDPETFKTQSDGFYAAKVAKVYRAYQQLLNENASLDFDDLLMKTALLLRDNQQVRDELNDRFMYLLVDEYQDTNHAQYCIAKSLVANHGNICVAGDPDQSIYRWRGADITNILAFEKDWPDATVVKLEENFRSTPDILSVADKLIAANKNRKPKSLIPVRPPAGKVELACFEDEQEEAQGVADKINNLIRQGVSARNIAVFYRVNAMSRAMEECFVRNQMPYQIVRGVEFYSRKEIRDILAYLKIIVNPADEIALLRIINTPARGIGKVTIDKVRRYALTHGLSFYQALAKVHAIDSLSQAHKGRITAFVKMIENFKKAAPDSVSQLIKKVFVESGLQSFFNSGKESDDNSAAENINELINAAAVYERHAEQPSLMDYLQQISLFSDADSYDPTTERVALMTLHAAKGLEFENVFIIGVEDGLLPHERSAESDDELEEERRLFFVGITRAETNLHISYTRYRTVRGQYRRAVPSPFLYELPLELPHQQPSSREDSYDDFDDDISYEPDEEVVPFTKGQLVKHKKFGLGRVEQFIEMGQNSVIVVKFKAGQTKTLMLKYANLTKV